MNRFSISSKIKANSKSTDNPFSTESDRSSDCVFSQENNRESVMTKTEAIESSFKIKYWDEFSDKNSPKK